MCPVGSVFLLRAALDVDKQSNYPSMTVSATVVVTRTSRELGPWVG